MYIETTSGATLSSAQAVTTTADSTNVFDITGAGVGNSPAMIGAGGLNTAMGFDVGAGEGAAVPQVTVIVTTATTVTGTLTIELKAAPDSGTYTEGSYTTIFKSAALTGTTQLAAGQIIQFPIPPILQGQALPRFYKLTYTVGASISVVLSAYISFNEPVLRDPKLYGNNFTVAS